MKSFVILGATGSIGTQALELVEQYPQSFRVEAISAYKQVDKVKEIIEKFPIKAVAMPAQYQKAIQEINENIIFYPLEDEGLIRLVETTKEANILNALVGAVGLRPTLKAIENNLDILLANKETLVVGGPIIKKALKTSTSRLIPIDSEHAALNACLKGRKIKDVEKLVITASGGSFRDKSKAELKEVTLRDALKHPNWSMGEKITIDSATMMNKVFEVIEAHYLFDVGYDKIEAIYHKESIVHAMVHFKDGNVLAHIGPSDMRIPILSAMQGHTTKRYYSLFDLTQAATLHFAPIDKERYSLFDLGLAVAKHGGLHVVTMNAANEVAVSRFLNGEIKFVDIETCIKRALDHFKREPIIDLKQVLSHDKTVRKYIYNMKI